MCKKYSHNKDKSFSEEQVNDIIDLYVNNILSLTDIGIKYGTTQYIIKKVLINNSIKIKERYKDKNTNKIKSQKININKDVLIDLYINKKLSTIEISKIFNVCHKTVYNRLLEYNIPTRSINDLMNDIEYREKHINRLQNAITDEVWEKQRQTNLERYGVDNPFKLEYFQQKARKTITDNNNFKCSNQQLYLSKILNMELNYLIDTKVVDMADIENRIYCEYDGSGHFLAIKFNQKTEKEFIQYEIQRYQILKRKNWKQIKIISSKDYLPYDEIIIESVNIAKSYLNENHSWFEINIDKGKLKCSQYEIDYDFGKLRKIKEKDLLKVS